jgi:hypothetical protein
MPSENKDNKRNGDLTIDKKYKILGNTLVNAKTKKQVKLLKKTGRGKHQTLTLSNRYQQILKDNWKLFVKDNEDTLPLKTNSNQVLKNLKSINTIPDLNGQIQILDELKPLLRDLTNEYNQKHNYKTPKLSEEYRKTVIKKLNEIQTKESNQHTFDLTKISIKELVRLIRSNIFDRKLMFKLKSDDEDSSGHMYALTDRTFDNLLNGFIDDHSEVVHGSDETLRQISFDTSALTLVALKEPEKKKTRRKGGAFFKYLNCTKFDLSLCGIFQCLNPYDYEVNCLVLALKNAGLDEVVLNRLIYKCCSRHVPKCKLHEVCKICEICIKLYVVRDDNGRRQPETYGDETKQTFDIGLLDEHYFWIYNTDITSYAIQHYHEIKNEEDAHQIIYKRNSGTYKRSTKRGLDSYKVVKLLLEIQNSNIPEEDKLLSSIFNEPDLLATSFYDIDKIDFDRIDTLQSVTETDIKYLIYEPKSKGERYKITIDTETFNDRTTNFVHTPFVVCMEDEHGHKQRFFGRNAMEKMLNSIPSNKGNVMLYIHNANYDIRFMFKYLNYFRPIFKGNRCIFATGGFKQQCGEFINLTVKDTYCMISMPLSDFGKSFGLDVVKDIMPYKLYNRKNIDRVYVPIQDGIDVLLSNKAIKSKKKKEETINQFHQNIENWNCKGDNDTFNIVEYASMYCEIDVSVLKQGYNKFRDDMLKLTGLDCDDFVTIQSMAEAYLLKEGVYEDVYKLSGFALQFIHKCIVGGRTMTNSNKMFHTEINLADFDACSLYPSAMSMLGYLKGIPKVIQPNQLNHDFLKSVDGYFVKVRITKVGKRRQFPLLSEITKDSVRRFHDDFVGKTVFVDKISLEDLIEFHDVEFEVLQGYYFDQGRNYKIQEVINKLYNTRKRMKAEKNPTEKIIKLFMNSMYGKSIIKPIETDMKVFNNQTQYDEFIYLNYNMIQETNRIGNKWFVKVRKAINDHFNYCHVGCEILSMSKRIMSQVMCLAEDLDIFMTYTDTDSIHIESDKVKYLGDEFMKKYHKELIGEDLCQFHVDFDMFDADGDKIKVKTDINSILGYFLGKKVYTDKLHSTDLDDNNVYDNHVRLKGVSNSCIQKKAQEDIYNGDVINIYKSLFDGDEIEFDLNDRLDDKGVFEFNHQTLEVSTKKDKFTRSMRFDLDIDRVTIKSSHDVKRFITKFRTTSK